MISRNSPNQGSLDIALFNYVQDESKKHFELYHFTEIKTPIIQPTEPLKHLPEWQNKISNEMLFLAHKENLPKEYLGLSYATEVAIGKVFIDQNISHLPWKVYSSNSTFSYAPTKYNYYKKSEQIHIALIGCQSISHDVQFLAMFDRLLSHTFSLNNYALSLNCLGCNTDQIKYKKKLLLFLQSNEAHGLCNTCKQLKNNNCMHVFACHEISCQQILHHAPKIIDNLCDTCEQEWIQLQDNLDLLSITYTLNPTIMPRFDYNNKIIFEFSSTLPEIHTVICTGGRCNELISTLGGQGQPALTATLNIEELMNLLEPVKEKLPLYNTQPLVLIIPISVEQHILALLLADTLRTQGLCIDVLLEQDSLENMLHYANKMGVSYSLLLGPAEQEARKVVVKNMITGTEDIIEQIDVYAYLTR